MPRPSFAFAGLAPVLLLALPLAACSSSATVTNGTTQDSGATPPGSEELGQRCTAGCGGEPGKKCASAPVDGKCANRLCLVDLAQPAGFVSYCTVDCGSTPCPSAFHCEDITSFGDGNVKRACVADVPNCGDGTKQLAEACDGASVAGYCDDACAKLTPPSVAARVGFARVRPPSEITTWADSDLKAVLPIVGDANGCGAVTVTGTRESSVQTQWTFCFGTAVATLDASFPRNTTVTSLKAPLAGTLSVVDKPGAEPRTLNAAVSSSCFVTVKGARERSLNCKLDFPDTDGSSLAFSFLGTWTPPPAP